MELTSTGERFAWWKINLVAVAPILAVDPGPAAGVALAAGAEKAGAQAAVQAPDLAAIDVLTQGLDASLAPDPGESLAPSLKTSHVHVMASHTVVL